MPLEISGGDINVTCGVGGEGATSDKNISGSATVSPNTETEILSYIVPADTILYVTDIFCLGDADGEFKVYKDTNIITEGRTSAAQRFFSHPFSGAYRFLETDELKITVTHHETADKDFASYVFGSEQ